MKTLILNFDLILILRHRRHTSISFRNHGKHSHCIEECIVLCIMYLIFILITIDSAVRVISPIIWLWSLILPCQLIGCVGDSNGNHCINYCLF